jgi:protein-arginine kinase
MDEIKRIKREILMELQNTFSDQGNYHKSLPKNIGTPIK